ncbi:hypothetical protein NL676_020320 [Syzygium grande]|nr:hypothetical protein NL676_020320 [Syzygium grande]
MPRSAHARGGPRGPWEVSPPYGKPRGGQEQHMKWQALLDLSGGWERAEERRSGSGRPHRGSRTVQNQDQKAKRSSP